MRQQIINNLVYTQDQNGNTVVDNYNSERVKGLVPAVERYNYLARQAGVNGLDMNNLNAIAGLTKPNEQYKTMPNGELLAFDGNTGSVTPLGNYADPQSAKDRYIKTDNGIFDVRTGQMVEGTQSTGRAYGTSGLDQQRMKTLSANHIAWLKNNSNEPESNSPYYSALQEALGISGQDDVTGGQKELLDDEETLSNRIMELRKTMSKEEVQGVLRREGLGFYATWVP